MRYFPSVLLCGSRLGRDKRGIAIERRHSHRGPVPPAEGPALTDGVGVDLRFFRFSGIAEIGLPGQARLGIARMDSIPNRIGATVGQAKCAVNWSVPPL